MSYVKLSQTVGLWPLWHAYIFGRCSLLFGSLFCCCCCGQMWQYLYRIVREKDMEIYFLQIKVKSTMFYQQNSVSSSVSYIFIIYCLINYHTAIILQFCVSCYLLTFTLSSSLIIVLGKRHHGVQRYDDSFLSYFLSFFYLTNDTQTIIYYIYILSYTTTVFLFILFTIILFLLSSISFKNKRQLNSVCQGTVLFVDSHVYLISSLIGSISG